MMDIQNTKPQDTTIRQADRRPVILMTPDLEEDPGANTEHEYVVRTNYAEAIAEAGGIPLILPYEAGSMTAAVALADGILITGARPGAEVSPLRSEFEKRLVQEALETGKPLLGVCHGMQLIGTLLGGTFATDLPVIVGESTDHMPRDIPDALAHEILIEPGSRFADWIGGTSAGVNSLHRHALTGSGSFDVVARAPDGVIEAFHGRTGSFCLGIQWHPEYRLTTLDRHILLTFIAHASGKISPKDE